MMSPLSRYSLQSLAALSRSPTSSRALLESVVERLHRQLDSDFLMRGSTKRHDSLAYVHRDTCRLAEQVLDSSKLWERFSDADQHVIQSTFTEISARHSKTIETVVEIVEEDVNLHDAAEKFLKQRLGIQLLCHHHCEISKDRAGGAIRQQLQVENVVDDAVVESSHVVEAHLLTCPPVKVSGSVNATAVRSWLHHSLVELLKNAMAATVKQHATSSHELPAIEVNLHKNDGETVSVEIVDAGTGIRDEQQAFRIGHTSQGKHWDRLDEQQSYAAVRSPLSSLGVGLSVARYQSEHFGGSLSLFNNSWGKNGCTARIALPIDDTLLEQVPGA